MLRLIGFRITTCKNSESAWYILNDKVKGKMNDVAISKSLWLLEMIFEHITCKKALPCCHEKTLPSVILLFSRRLMKYH